MTDKKTPPWTFHATGTSAIHPDDRTILEEMEYRRVLEDTRRACELMDREAEDKEEFLQLHPETTSLELREQHLAFKRWQQAKRLPN